MAKGSAEVKEAESELGAMEAEIEALKRRHEVGALCLGDLVAGLRGGFVLEGVENDGQGSKRMRSCSLGRNPPAPLTGRERASLGPDSMVLRRWGGLYATAQEALSRKAALEAGKTRREERSANTAKRSARVGRLMALEREAIMKEGEALVSSPCDRMLVSAMRDAL